MDSPLLHTVEEVAEWWTHPHDNAERTETFDKLVARHGYYDAVHMWKAGIALAGDITNVTITGSDQ